LARQEAIPCTEDKKVDFLLQFKINHSFNSHKLTEEEFCNSWISNRKDGKDEGIALLLERFVTLILIAQLVLFTSQTIVKFIRSWILLHITARINISMISDFLIKLMKLPIKFFDIKMQIIARTWRYCYFITPCANPLFSRKHSPFPLL
jgi:hypothetical protein